jgi:hypothetical protein
MGDPGYIRFIVTISGTTKEVSRDDGALFHLSQKELEKADKVIGIRENGQRVEVKNRYNPKD